MPPGHIYSQRMTTSAETAPMRAVNEAIAGEVRAIMARKDIRGTDVARAMGVEQSYFSRRHSGKTPWSAAELKLVMDILDEDIVKVYAAGAAALESIRPTNPCLSDSAQLGSGHLSGWAARGLELARRLYPHLIYTVDSGVNAA